MYDGKFIATVKDKVRGVEKLSNIATREWGFHIMSGWDPLPVVTEPEFFISSQRLGHRT